MTRKRQQPWVPRSGDRTAGPRTGTPLGAGQVRLQPDANGQVLVDTTQFPVPDRSYYANSARLERIEFGVLIAFGQLIPRQAEITSAVCVEMPWGDFRALHDSLQESFRQLVAINCRGYGNMRAFPEEPPTADRPGVVVCAHLLRVLANERSCSMDFFEYTHGQTAPEFFASAVLRVRCLPPVLAYFVERSDALIVAG